MSGKPRTLLSWSAMAMLPATAVASVHGLPKDRTDLAIQRILVRHGFSRDLAELLLDDYRRALDHFDRHPVTTPLSEEESGSFQHS